MGWQAKSTQEVTGRQVGWQEAGSQPLGALQHDWQFPWHVTRCHVLLWQELGKQIPFLKLPPFEHMEMVGTAGMALAFPGQQLSTMVLVLTLPGSCNLSVPEFERHLIHRGFYSPSLGVFHDRVSFLVIVSTQLPTNIWLAGFRSVGDIVPSLRTGWLSWEFSWLSLGTLLLLLLWAKLSLL